MRHEGRVKAFCCALPAALFCAAAACSHSRGPGKTIIQDTGSDTQVNLAQAWAEQYARLEPAVSVEVSGGGSGVGIAALSNGVADIANCSRRFEPRETETARKNTGKDPHEFIVAYDALAVYVNKNNPSERNHPGPVGRGFMGRAGRSPNGRNSASGCRTTPRMKSSG